MPLAYYLLWWGHQISLNFRFWTSIVRIGVRDAETHGISLEGF